MTVMRHRHQQGFAIPIAMGFGLMVLLISVSIVVRSQADSTTASTQKAAARGLSAAETGIGRIQEKINLARVIAAYPACNSWSTGTGTSCNDTAGISWKNSTAIPYLVTGCTGAPTASDISSIPDRTWKDVESGDATKGQYRFIDYTYTAPQGTLTVEGRVNQSGSGSTATSGLRTSTSRLQVKIPVADASASASVPALWIGNGSTTNMNNDKVNGNIVVNTCGLSSLTNPPTTANLTDATAYSVKAVFRSFPGTPSLPSSYNNLTTGTLNPWISLPRAGDVTYTDVKGNVRYAYLVKNLVKNGNGAITLVSSTVKVDLFVQGDIDLGGTPSINASGNSSQMRIFGNELVSGSTYKYGCASGVTCPTSKVEFNGTGDINAFIYAPAGVGGVSGGGNANGNIKGALWVKDWVYKSSNSKVKVDSVGNYGDYGFDNSLDRPTLSPITAWDRQEISY